MSYYGCYNPELNDNMLKEKTMNFLIKNKLYEYKRNSDSIVSNEMIQNNRDLRGTIVMTPRMFF
jgi:hypothetical protein